MLKTFQYCDYCLDECDGRGNNREKRENYTPVNTSEIKNNNTLNSSDDDKYEPKIFKRNEFIMV